MKQLWKPTEWELQSELPVGDPEIKRGGGWIVSLKLKTQNMWCIVCFLKGISSPSLKVVLRRVFIDMYLESTHSPSKQLITARHAECPSGK